VRERGEYRFEKYRANSDFTMRFSLCSERFCLSLGLLYRLPQSGHMEVHNKFLIYVDGKNRAEAVLTGVDQLDGNRARMAEIGLGRQDMETAPPHKPALSRLEASRER
jgi:hypothetical protein